jgi:hypothetical protein
MAKTPKIEEPSLDEEKVEETKTEIEEPSLDGEDEPQPKSPEEITPAPSPEPSAPAALNAHAPIGSKAAAMRDLLKAQPKVKVFIPLAPGEKQGVTQSVILNGYPMYIRKGSYVDVPQAVAEVLEVKLKHKMSIENHPNRITGEGDIPMTRYGN